MFSGGLSWEEVELDSLRRFLPHVNQPGLQPLQVLDLPVRDVYGAHWNVTGRQVPDADSPDTAVFQPGRNAGLPDRTAYDGG
jgi:7-cyano-7-deazaguanine synthase